MNIRKEVVKWLYGIYGLTASVVTGVINTVVTGKLIVRQTGGVAGTDQVEVSHDGTRGYIQSKDGGFQLLSTDGSVAWVAINDTNAMLLGNTSVAIDRSSNRRIVLQSDAYTFSSSSADWSVGRSAAGVMGFFGATSAAAGGFSATANTPAQIAADTDNYSPGVGLNQRWSSDASRNVTGMVAGVAGETRFVWNVGAQNIVLKHQVTSTAANQFLCSTGADITLTPNKCALAMYDATTARWRVTLLP